MKNLLNKELRLALHPTNYLFLIFSAMVLIPNYPYMVTFFYSALGIFFICLTGRENHDIYYTMSLPVRKRDIVRARFLTVMLIEALQLFIAVPFAMLRSTYKLVGPNIVGIEANAAFFGLSLVMLGLFNFIFFTRYYKNPDKVGGAFVRGSIAIFVYMIISEACTNAIPYMRDVIDTYDPINLGPKLIFLAAGIIIFAALTILAYSKSVRSFENLDL